jgi:hypothetical protein
MHYETVKRTVFRDFRLERQRETALNLALTGWFPPSPEILALIHSKIISGEYQNNPTALVSDLKLDLASFGRILPRLRPSTDLVNGFVSPVEDAAALDPEQLTALLPKSPSLISRHRLANGSAALRATLTCSLQSTAAAESFAAAAVERGATVNVGDAFSASMLRQLGLNLLAWNYPANFFSIVKSFGRSSVECDAEMKRVFGYSPMGLATACARRWNIKPVLIETLEPIPKTDNPLREICDISDSFGRMHHKAVFPTAQRDWDQRRERLCTLLGTDKTDQITDLVETNIERTLEVIFRSEPKKFNQAFAAIRPVEKRAVYLQNPFLRKLPFDVSLMLAQVHESLQGEGGVITALQQLTSSAIPESGFVRGLICVEDEKTQALRLAVRIGLQPNEVGSIKRLAAAALEARDSLIPMLSEAHSDRGTVKRISSSFGGASAGVLVLELSKEAADDPTRDNLAYFQAVRKCLECCLESQPEA